MPARPLAPDAPTIYLDHSTLIDAFKATDASSSNRKNTQAYRRLFSWLGETAKSANLCISFVHALELSYWGDQAAADAMAAWLDELPLVWLERPDRTREAEATYWLKVAAGVTPLRPVDPFSPSGLTVLDFSPEAIAFALGKPFFRTLVEALRGREKRGDDQHMAELIRQLRIDGDAVATAGLTRKEKEDRLALNERVALRQIAAEADRRLQASADPEYSARPRMHVHIQDAFVELFATTPQVMPTWRVARAFHRGLAETVMARTPGSKNERELLSSARDFLHLEVAAAYCDVFTCDELTDKWLAGARESLGLCRQLSVARSGSPERFVDDVVATCGH